MDVHCLFAALKESMRVHPAAVMGTARCVLLDIISDLSLKVSIMGKSL
jgi:hypothetical protein